MSEKLRGWVEVTRIWIVRVLAVGISLFAVVAHTGLIGEEKIKPIYYVPAAFLLLLLIFEVQLSSGEPKHAAPRLLSWHEALPAILEAVSHANTKIYIIGSSTESMYIPLKDALEHLKNIELVVVLRSCKSSDKPRMAKQNQYLNYWQKLDNPQTGVKVTLKFYPNSFLRAIIVDSSEGFLGFYEYDKKDARFYGHSVPVMHVRKGGHFDDYLLKVYLNRAAQMSEDGSEKPF